MRTRRLTIGDRRTLGWALAIVGALMMEVPLLHEAIGGAVFLVGVALVLA